MSVFTFVLWVVIASLAAGIINNWMKHRAKAPEQPDAKLQEELAELKKRVVALEQIVTDSEYQLKKDFEKL